MWIISVFDFDESESWPVYYTEDDALAQQAMKEIAEEHKDHTLIREHGPSEPGSKPEISEDRVYCPQCEKMWTLDGSAQRLK